VTTQARRLAGSLPAVVVVGGLSFLALWGLISRSLRPGSLIGGALSTDAWRRVLDDPAFREAVWFTLGAALVATVIAVAISIPLGFALRSRGRRTHAVMGVLIPVPHLVVAATTVAWFGPGGLVDRSLGEVSIVGDRLGLGVMIVYIVKEIPFLVLLIVAALDAATRELDEAAQSLGASWRYRWRYVLGPRLAWPVGLGALVVAAFVIGSTEVALVIGPLKPDSITTYAISVTRLRGPVARADSAVALSVSAAIVCSCALIVLGALAFARRRAMQR